MLHLMKFLMNWMHWSYELSSRICGYSQRGLRSLAYRLAELSKDKELAKRFVRELQQSCKMLETFPESGALPRDRILRSSGYRFLAFTDYLTFYTIDKEKRVVYIAAVFNGKKDYVRVMRKYI